ncbi:MAG: hypothetical protein B6226_02090 [Candidatus Cloacimonetes bacterium 4572_65]|nr:MAG: hypothetical protein B6226_02090 [Candidatus Cloacimonetes bacterium 4572_65]
MKSYRKEHLELSGVDYLFKKNISTTAPQTTPPPITPNRAMEQEPAQQEFIPQEEVSKLTELYRKYCNCNKCEYSQNRTNFIYGEGNQQADIFIIGEGPSDLEDRENRAFIGDSGTLLTNMLKAININRDDIYLTNVLKCTPHDHTKTSSAARETCLPYTIEQINIIKPKVIVVLGKMAAITLFKTPSNRSLESFRDEKLYIEGIRTFVTYHPSALIHNSKWKLPTWHDLQKIGFFLKELEMM